MQQKLLIGGWFDFQVDNKIDPYQRIPFIRTILGEKSESYIKTNNNSNYFNRLIQEEFHNEKDYIVENEDQIKKSLYSYVQEIHRKGMAPALKNCLLILLKDNANHDYIRGEFLYNFLDDIKDNDFQRWTNFLYFYLYFAIRDQLHHSIAFLKYFDLQNDIDEYNKEILLGYGVYGNPGMSKLIQLANRNNIIAKFELGECYYYGRFNADGVPDFSKALSCYEAILNSNSSHPLALWTISYMMFSYRQKGSELEHAYIEKFEKEKQSEGAWYDKMVHYVQNAYIFGSAAAANLIGKMKEGKGGNVPRKYLEILPQKPAIDFYKEAAENGYAYAMNNLYAILIKEAEIENSSKKARKAIQYLEDSAETYEPWACNKLARHYLFGFSLNNNDIINKDEGVAFKWFKRAEFMAERKNFFFPILNLIEHFYNNKNSKKYSEISEFEQIKLLENVLLRSTNSDEQSQAEKLLKSIKRQINKFYQQLEKNQNSHNFSKFNSLVTKKDYKKIFENYSVYIDKEGLLFEKILKDNENLIKISSGLSVAIGNAKESRCISIGKTGKSKNSSILKSSTLFDIASITKCFLPMIFLMIENEGVIHLDDPVSKYCHDFTNLPIDLKISDLLAFDKVEITTENHIANCTSYEEAVDEIRRAKFNYIHKPIYSDMNAIVLQTVLRSITGKDFTREFTDRFVKKLKLRETVFRQSSVKELHSVDYTDELRILKNKNILLNNPPSLPHDEKARILSNGGQNLCAHAGLFVSTADMIRISQALLAGDLLPIDSLKRIVDGSGYIEPSDESQTYGFQCYRKHNNLKFNEVPHCFSDYTIAMSGFTGCYWALDLLNKKFIFIGGNRINQCITKIDNESTYVEKIEHNGKEYINSINYVYERDSLRDELAKIALCL